MNGKTSTARRSTVHGPEAQEQILEAVDELFYREGSRAVGVDAVAKRARLNKMALYRQFQSKEGLLLHYLDRNDKRFWGYIEGSIAKHPGDPAKQLHQIFVDLAPRASRPGYRGCPFVNVAVEYPDPEHPGRKMVAGNKSQLLARFAEIAEQTDARDPALLANGLALLIEGVYAGSQTYAPGHPLITTAPNVARAMIEAATGRPLAA
ncbi:MAG: TetR/AcrR family transcriptional regulator [Burkholderiales bacterium]|nr:TetR/AcrR family transcriptional regulator [Burkholderiales bacterium]